MLGLIMGVLTGIDLAVVSVVAATILLLVLKLGRSLTARVGNIEVAVNQVNKQVNHVDDLDTEPTLRQMVCTIHEQMIDARLQIADNTKSLTRVERRVASVETAQIAQAERLGEVGRLARSVADRNRKIDESPERGMSNVEVLIIVLVILLILIVVGVLPR